MLPLVNLTRQQFECSIKAFEYKASIVVPEQEWHLKQDVTGFNKYLMRKCIFLTTAQAPVNDEDNNLELDHDISDLAAIESSDMPTVQVEYHVVYSATYQVPVLYFNAYFSNGSVLTRDELDQFVTGPNYREPLRASPILQQGSISQQEHPVLGLPFYYIHPCDTAALMTQVDIHDIDCYIISWLSFFGPLVGLYLKSTFGSDIS